MRAFNRLTVSKAWVKASSISDAEAGTKRHKKQWYSLKVLVRNGLYFPEWLIKCAENGLNCPIKKLVITPLQKDTVNADHADGGGSNTQDDAEDSHGASADRGKAAQVGLSKLNVVLWLQVCSSSSQDTCFLENCP